jgi:hypothetical protein
VKPQVESAFHAAFRGTFTSLLSWEALAALWDTVRARADAGWYIYAIGTPVPGTPRSADEVRRFIDAVDALLRKDHREDYCGIVYADSKDEPTFIKIFDPNNLGVSCGFSKNPPLPGWLLTRVPPEPLADRRPLPGNRQRWWDALWR